MSLRATHVNASSPSELEVAGPVFSIQIGLDESYELTRLTLAA